MKIYVDIDGILCETPGNNYLKSRPIQKNIDKINKLYKMGHTIVIWSARGATSKKSWYKHTKQQLYEWGVMFTYLRMDKPSYDIIIDDRCIKIEDLDVEKIEKEKENE